MFFRIRVLFVAALLLMLLTSMTALAKGNFSFITITGTNIEEPVHVTDPALTSSFFAFADFYRDKTIAPTNPGAGYEITRFYMSNNVVVPFDRLHYYPDAGLVYYDGIAGGGSSEYDGKWYTAKPEIKVVFEHTLPSHAPLFKLITQPQAIRLITVSIGVVMLLSFILRTRAATDR